MPLLEEDINALVAKYERENGMISRLFSRLFTMDEYDDDYKTFSDHYKSIREYTKAINMMLKHIKRIKDKNDIADAYSRIAVYYDELVDIDNSIKYLQMAINVHEDVGNYRKVAELNEKIGNIACKKDDHDLAIKAYNVALANYVGENSPSAVRVCKTKLADVYITTNKYEDGFALYDEIVRTEIDSIRAYTADAYIMKAVLCKMATNDVVAVERIINNYKAIYTKMNPCKSAFIDSVYVCMIENDINKFKTSYIKLDEYYKCNPVELQLLMTITDNIRNNIDNGLL